MKGFASHRRHARFAVSMICWSLLAALPADAADQPAGDLTHMPSDRPVQVEMSVDLVKVSQIQDHEEKFDVEFYLFMSWQDRRLAFDPDQTGSKNRIVPVEEIWTPEPELIDDLDVSVQGSKHAHILPDGTVLYRQYYRGTVSSNFDLHEFPFDRHELELHIEATSGEIDDVRYVAGESGPRQGPSKTARVVPHGWNLLATSSEVSKNHDARMNETYSRFTFRIEIERDPHYYWWSIVLPLLPIVITSWSVFWMDPKEFSSQIGVGVTAMLTVVAYRITIDSSLPPLTYMTRMDYFLLVCQVCVFGSFLLSVMVHVCFALDTAEMVALAKRINQRCRWAPPLAMTATCMLLLLLPGGVAMTIAVCALGIALLACRPTPANLRRWWLALLVPERLVRTRLQAHPAHPEGGGESKARASYTARGQE
ncbi:MAG TPA: hypothetical protein VMV69_10115 [Pirellulales bacterium]|nr:hypothetical protein [Pirellulales bacterium]